MISGLVERQSYNVVLQLVIYDLLLLAAWTSLHNFDLIWQQNKTRQYSNLYVQSKNNIPSNNTNLCAIFLFQSFYFQLRRTHTSIGLCWCWVLAPSLHWIYRTRKLSFFEFWKHYFSRFEDYYESNTKLDQSVKLWN